MDGILLFNKPILWTSHDAVDFLRRRIGQRSIGHAGTLDPMATGLLVMLVGKATKLSGSLMGLDKDYLGSLYLGMTTDTQDLEGRIMEWIVADSFKEEDLKAVFLSLCGHQLQTPPAYSAVKKNGKKLYELARLGIPVEVQARNIVVKEFRLLGLYLPEATFFVRCSTGTYVRTLCDEVGRRLGVGATLSGLARTAVGNYRLDSALDEAQILSLTREQIEQRLLK